MRTAAGHLEPEPASAPLHRHSSQDHRQKSPTYVSCLAGYPRRGGGFVLIFPFSWFLFCNFAC